MAELKTKKNDASVAEFINSFAGEKGEDAKKLLQVFEEVTGVKPVMWGGSIVGYGQYHYKSERSKQEGDWPLTGFSPRKQNISIYIMPGFDNYKALLAKLGTHKHSVGCLYVKRLSDIDLNVLKELIKRSVKDMQAKYPESSL